MKSILMSIQSKWLKILDEKELSDKLDEAKQ